MALHVLGIDIGGTNIKLGLVAESGELLEHCVITTPQKRNLADVVGAVSLAARALLARTDAKPCGVGVAAPGVVDLDGELVIMAPNFPSWRNEPARVAMAEALQLPAVLGNDVDCFGVAEHRWGAARGLKHFIAVAVGTGVGGALILNGKLYRGAHGGAAELGFTVISDNGREVAGVPGVIEAYIGRQGFDDMVLQAFPTGEVPTPKRITDLASAGDERARQIHTQIAALLAKAAASWLHILDPEAIVIGGGTLAGADFFFDEFRRQLKLRARPTYVSGVKILPSGLGYYAGVQGAGAIWFSAHDQGLVKD